MRFVAWLVVFVFLVFGCEKKDPDATDNDEQAQPEASAEATNQYASMSPDERLEAVLGMTFLTEGTRAGQLDALLAAAANEAERASLKKAARPLFATEYEEVLEQKKKPGKVTATGADRATLLVRGPHCSKFLLENMTSGDDGEVIEQLGFTRVACESKALELAAEI